MGETTYNVGDKVKLHPEHSGPDERDLVYIVCEWNIDRGHIAPEAWNGLIRPQELVRSFQIARAEVSK